MKFLSASLYYTTKQIFYTERSVMDYYKITLANTPAYYLRIIIKPAAMPCI